jgi:bifunctional non-homologous end joining protein LigD
VGYYGPDGLLFASRVGTGFSERALAALYDGMQKINRATCPFVNLPEKRRRRFSWIIGMPALYAGPTPVVSSGAQ